LRREELRRAEEEKRRKEDAKRQHRQGTSSESQARDGFSRAKAPGSQQNRPPGGTASKPRPAPKKTIGRRGGADHSLYARMGALLSNLQSLVLSTAQSLRTNPLLLLRTILFILVFALAFGRREMRARIKRMIERGWLKIKGTVGMGVKVSSI
jgi:hypothetical protein